MKKWWIWSTAVVVVIFVVAAHAGGQEQGATVSPNLPKIGQTVMINPFVIKVNSVKYVSAINDGGAVAQNGGVWALVNITLKNTSTTSQTLDASLFTLLRGKTKYSASDTADLYVNKGNNFYFTQLNPGLSATGTIAFNVPAQGNYDLQVAGGLLSGSHVLISLS
jgi:hypothetical protein